MSTITMHTKHGEPQVLVRWAEDIIAPKYFPLSEERLHKIKEFEYRDGDVLLCSYPKTGTHWMSALIQQLLMRQVEKELLQKYKGQRLDLLEAPFPQERFNEAISPRLLATHLRPKRLPTVFLEGKGKIVAILRNPKDVAVSLYYHLKNAEMIQNNQDWDEFFISFHSGMCHFGQYLDYIKAWESTLKSSKNLDIEIFYFEQLKTNGLESMRRLAKHLGYDLNDKELQKSLDSCTYAKLVEQDNKILEDMKSKAPVADKDGKSIIYKKCEIGDWQNHFTVAQNEMYDELLMNTLGRSMFTFNFGN